jgi:hypothetical protein
MTDHEIHRRRDWWPMSPASALVLLAAVVPTTCYVNRGFTQWFHWAGIFYLLTQWQFMEQFQIVSGTSICLGWYASLAYEFFQHDRFCHPLYRNMPEGLMEYYHFVVDGEDGSQSTRLDFQSNTALVALSFAHLLDLLAHPLLTCYFWRRHAARGRTLKDAFSWPVILAAYAYSRLWSLTHTKYNTGEFGLWYFGFDVYVMDNLDSWYPAYIAESCTYTSIVVWKLWEAGSISNVFRKKNSTHRKDDYKKKPELLLSESSLSINSTR